MRGFVGLVFVCGEQEECAKFVSLLSLLELKLLHGVKMAMHSDLAREEIISFVSSSKMDRFLI